MAYTPQNPNGQATMANSAPVVLASNQSAISVSASGSFPVSGTFWQATQPVSAASLPLPSGAATETTLSAVNGKLPTLTVTATRLLTDGSGVTQPVSGTFWPATQPVSATASAPVSMRMADSTATQLRFYAVAAASGLTGVETAITLTKSSGTAATSTGASYVVTSGKTFKLISITFATRGNATATAQSTTFNLRVNTAGAVTTSSTPVILSMRCATPATASAWDRVQVNLPDAGIEIPGNGTLQFGITAAATFVTNAPTWDVTIIGYEY
jgi:hypothetical protein